MIFIIDISKLYVYYINMKNTIVFTSTIHPELLSWLNNYAKKSSRTRRELLEESIILYKEHVIKQNMKDDFARANSSEQEELADWGMQDYIEILETND